jgi:hypothetical protein
MNEGIATSLHTLPESDSNQLQEQPDQQSESYDDEQEERAV